MKKLMIMAAVTMIGVCAQAASAAWVVSNLYVPVAKDLTKDQSGIVPSSGSKFAADALTLSLFYVDGKGEEKFITSAATTGDGVKKAVDFWTQAQAHSVFDANDGQTAFDFIVKAEYEVKEGKYSYYGEVNKDLANIDSQKQTVTFNSLQNASWTYTANAVPEPTSALLLLLGVAGLALRRRRA